MKRKIPSRPQSQGSLRKRGRKPKDRLEHDDCRPCTENSWLRSFTSFQAVEVSWLSYRKRRDASPPDGDADASDASDADGDATASRAPREAEGQPKSSGYPGAADEWDEMLLCPLEIRFTQDKTLGKGNRSMTLSGGCVPSTNRFALCGGYRACGIARLLLSIHPFFYRRGPIVHVLPKIRSVALSDGTWELLPPFGPIHCLRRRRGLGGEDGRGFVVAFALDFLRQRYPKLFHTLSRMQVKAVMEGEGLMVALGQDEDSPGMCKSQLAALMALVLVLSLPCMFGIAHAKVRSSLFSCWLGVAFMLLIQLSFSFRWSDEDGLPTETAEEQPTVEDEAPSEALAALPEAARVGETAVSATGRLPVADARTLKMMRWAPLAALAALGLARKLDREPTTMSRLLRRSSTCWKGWRPICWCKTSEENQTSLITDSTSLIETQTVVVKESTAMGDRLTWELRNLAKEIAAHEATLEKADVLRRDQREKFAEDSKSLKENIDAVAQALAAVNGSSFLQSPESPAVTRSRDRARAMTVRTTVRMTVRCDAQLPASDDPGHFTKGLGFLQKAQVGGPAETVAGMLQAMVDDFQIDLKEPSSFRGTADARLAALGSAIVIVNIAWYIFIQRSKYFGGVAFVTFILQEEQDEDGKLEKSYQALVTAKSQEVSAGQEQVTLKEGLLMVGGASVHAPVQSRCASVH
eukprot:g4573.t1